MKNNKEILPHYHHVETTATHVWLSIGCRKKESRHGDFRVDTKVGRFICNHCNEDFTGELKSIQMLIDNFKNHVD